jgi:hypothetical protein
MKKLSALLCLCLVALGSCGTPKSRPTLSDQERYSRDDDRGDRDRNRDRGRDDDDDDDRRHWWD